MTDVSDLWPDFDRRWIVHRDDDLIVVNKPAHIPAQAADAEHDDDLVVRLKRWLGAERGQPPDEVYLGVHQRLDRDTSGLCLFTLRREANAAIAAQFEHRSIQKTYLAVVQDGGVLRGPRVLEDHLARGRDGRMAVVSPRDKAGKRAVTRVQVLRRNGPRALLELGCDTGRTHQLRVQLAHEGAAIAGDRLYGGKGALRLLLHAERLGLRHPSDDSALALHAPAPMELEHFFAHGAVDAASDMALLQRALQLAVEQRFRLGRARAAERPTTAFRLLHGVAEGAPELAVDVYGDHLVVHFLGDAIEAHQSAVLDALESLGFAGIYLKRHPRQKNALGDRTSQELAPSEPVRGVAAPADLVVFEQGLSLGVRLGDGLRTGLFLDQRENRQRVMALASGKRVLNLFAYTGAFSVAALAGGAAEAVCVDASASALAWAQRNVERIGGGARHRIWHTDVFDALQHMARRGEQFDLIILDPPSYSTTRTRRFVATRDYQKLAEACLGVLAPGGQLLACTNHHGVSQRRLRRDLQQAMALAGREIAKLKDLPTPLDFPAAPGEEPHNKGALLTCGTS